MAHAAPRTSSRPATRPSSGTQHATPGAAAHQGQAAANPTQRAVQHLLREGNLGDLLHVVADGVGSWLQGHLAAAWTSALQEAARPGQAPGAAHGSASRGRGTLAQGPEARHALTPAGAAALAGENGSGANAPHLEGVWTTAKAAAMAGVTPGTIRRWRRTGRLRSVGKGRSLLFRADEVYAAMRAGDPLAAPDTPDTPDTPDSTNSARSVAARQARARRVVQGLTADADDREARARHGASGPAPEPEHERTSVPASVPASVPGGRAR